jgi:TetR/AcrR family transcriptional repressor of nem operon
MELFWTQGYDATSVSDLTTVLGVHPGSLYRTFGDKHALFLRALERYRQSQARPLAPALLAGGPVLPRIRAVLAGFIELAAGEGNPRGCLAGAVAGMLADVEDGFLQGLRAAAGQGEIPAAVDLAAWAAALTMLVQGLQVVVKADPDPRRLLRSVDAVLSALAGPEGLHPHGNE